MRLETRYPTATRPKAGLRARPTEKATSPVTAMTARGIPDKDTIEAFVTTNDMRSALFYHNDSFSSQVSNLTAINDT